AMKPAHTIRPILVPRQIHAQMPPRTAMLSDSATSCGMTPPYSKLENGRSGCQWRTFLVPAIRRAPRALLPLISPCEDLPVQTTAASVTQLSSGRDEDVVRCSKRGRPDALGRPCAS